MITIQRLHICRHAYWQGQFDQYERAVLQTLCCSNGKVCSIEYQNEQH